MHRRQYLSVLGAATLAGCLGQGSGDGSGEDGGGFEINTSSPTAVVESWYPVFIEGSLEEQKKHARTVFHSESWRLDSIEQQKEEANVADNEFGGIETEVVKEGLSKEEIQQDDGYFIGDELATQIANEQEAVMVKATYTVITEQGMEGDEQVRLIVVNEGGEWQILREIIEI
jgi:hypothetical protein